MNDVITALRTFLTGQASVTALVADRIYGGRMPLVDQDSPPEGAILLRLSGGTPVGGFVHLQRPRVDVTFYAPTPARADAIRRVVHPLFRALEPQEISGTLVHAIEEEGGPVSGVEPDTNWPYVFTSWRILASEQ